MGVFERGKQIILTFSYALLSRERGEIIGMAVYWAYNWKEKKNIAEVAKAIFLTIIFSSYSLQATI